MSARPQVLVIDDDPLMHALYEEALGEQFDLSFADSGESGLSALRRQRPEVVLLDVQMPGLDGYETCRRLRAEWPEGPPVVFVSSHDQLDDRMRGYDAGGSEYLTKPWEAPELVVKIQRQLRSTQERRSLAAERDEAVGAVLQSADMAGELGVVLDFQREVNNCANYESLAQRLFAALANYGLEGCVRMQGRFGTLSVNQTGGCTALEASILEKLIANKEGPRIQPMGPNTSFNFGNIVLFVRDLPMLRSANMDAEEAERHGRAIDNVALLLEGAASRLVALDSANAVQDLDKVRRLLSLIKGALAEVSRRNQAMTQAVSASFEHLQRELEESYIHLGLMSRQEDHLSELVRSHASAAMQALAQGRSTEAALQRIIQELSRN